MKKSVVLFIGILVAIIAIASSSSVQAQQRVEDQQRIELESGVVLGLLPGQVVELHAELKKEAIVVISEAHYSKADSVVYRVFVGKINRVLEEKTSHIDIFKEDGIRIFRAGRFIATERSDAATTGRTVFARKF